VKYIRWNPEKSDTILNNPERGVSLELIAERIQSGCYVDIIVRKQYPDQKAFVVPIEGDIWCVPFREDKDSIHLITAWPDRKLRRKYNGKTSA